MSKPTLWDRPYAGLAVTLIAALVFAPTLLFHRVAFDDNWLWGDGSPLRSLDPATLRTMFFELDARTRHSLGTEYLPVRDLLVALDMWIWGASDQGPHLTQLVLYAATVYGLGTLLVRFGWSREVAWTATLLWAVHPLHVESVAWLSERKGILAGLFVIGCGHAWLCFRAGRSHWWLVLAALAAVCGVWSKAFAMFGPVVFALWDRMLLENRDRRTVTAAVIGGAALLAAIPVVLVARDAGVVDSAFELQPDDRWTASVGALGHYMQSLVLARAPSLSYPIQTVGASATDLAVGALALMAAVALVAWRGEGRARRIAVVGWAAIWYVPLGHLLTRVHIAVADRFVYLWCLAGCIAAAWLVARVRQPVRTLAIAALACVLPIKSVRAQQSWTNSSELFATAFANNPTDPRAVENYADLLFSIQRVDEAFAVVDRGLAHNPLDAYLLSTKAEMLRALGNPLALGTAGLAAASGHASTMWQYAGLLAEAGRPVEALTFAEAATRRRPEVPHYAWRHVELLLVLGRFPAAEAEARALLARHPSSASHMTIARVFVQARRHQEADLHFLFARQLGAANTAIRELREEILPAPK